ncbi:MAG: CBS domain-containing protein [Bdellovibrionales bacterium]|nr:CBS domain-containing protein [Bdellovibrionales bacterium]
MKLIETAQFPQGALVRDYMNWPVLTVERNQDLKSVVKMMMIDKISSVIVTEKNELVGIITTQDLLKVLLEFLSNPGSSKKYGIESFFEDDWIGSTSVV